MEEKITASVITLSTRASRNEREDTSGPALCALLREEGWEVVRYEVLPDDEDRLKEELVKICDGLSPHLLFTIGGTGLSPTDVTPEATKRVIEREVPGIAETVRAKSLEKTDRAMLSRAKSGVRGKTLIVNFPGSERAVRESFEVVRRVLPHAVETILGKVKDCGRE
jgi:molybdopterin adenylyltransferase